MDEASGVDVPSAELSTLSSNSAAAITAINQTAAALYQTTEHAASIITTTTCTTDINDITTTDIYDNQYISPQYFLGILNIIAGAAILINVPHLVLISCMNVGTWTAARNFKYFVIFLALTDLFLSAGRLCLDNEFVQQWMYNNHWLCVTTATILPSFNVFQTTILALASIERYIAASHGIKYSSKLFIKHFPVIMALTLLFWLFMYTVIAILFHDVAYSLQGASECQISSKAYPYLELVSAFAGGLNLLAIIICYLMLVCKTRSISKAANRPGISKRAAKLNRTVGVLVVTKVLLWMPIIMFVILRTFQIRNTELNRVGSCCIYLCSIANPILYGITSSKYRRHLRNKLLCQEEKDNSASNGTSRDRSSNSNQPVLSISDSSLTQPPTAQQTLPPSLLAARGRPIL
mgnify:FL=1